MELMHLLESVFTYGVTFIIHALEIMGIIVIGVFAFAFDLLVRYLERFAIPWKGRV